MLYSGMNIFKIFCCPFNTKSDNNKGYTHKKKKKSYVQGSTEGLSADERKNIKPSVMVPYL